MESAISGSNCWIYSISDSTRSITEKPIIDRDVEGQPSQHRRMMEIKRGESQQHHSRAVNASSARTLRIGRCWRLGPVASHQ